MDKQLVSAADLAVYLGVSRDFVYAHAAELGGRRLGTGPKARLRFTFEDADLWLTACQAGRGSEVPAVPVVEPFRPRRRRGSLGSGVELLPIRGEQAA